MSDLISRSALIKRLWNHHSEVVANPECYTDVEDISDDICAIVSIIDEFPTIEAVPVVHGEWEICEEPNVFDTCGNPATYARCKNCGFRWSNKYHVKNYFKHCPECGARMDGAE